MFIEALPARFSPEEQVSWVAQAINFLIADAAAVQELRLGGLFVIPEFFITVHLFLTAPKQPAGVKSPLSGW